MSANATLYEKVAKTRQLMREEALLPPDAARKVLAASKIKYTPEQLKKLVSKICSILGKRGGQANARRLRAGRPPQKQKPLQLRLEFEEARER